MAAALGRIPSGCAILTACAGGRRTGMLASWYQQAAFDPPMLSVAVARKRGIVELIELSGGFALNLLGDKPTSMFKHFGRGFDPDEDAFAGLSVVEVPGGVMIEGELACLGCRVAGRTEAGDHWLYLGRVAWAKLGAEGPPHVHVRKNGLSY
jgi:flavin reductase (DIM6/NTAB) family NADH-FMN oxidoreductase RutF